MTAKKTPQDRKPKAVKPKIERAEDVEGFELLHPIEDVPVWEQAPLLALVAELTEGADTSGNIELSSSDAVRLLGKIGAAMLPFAVDAKAFTKFASGGQALQRTANLAIAWTSSLGEDESSDDS